MKIWEDKENLVIGDFDEVLALQLALKLENDGIKFYTKACQISPSPGARKIFSALLKDEEKHSLKFKKMLAAVLKEKNLEIDKGAEEEFFDFLPTEVFGDLLQIPKQISNLTDEISALAFGEKIEFNSIKFYKAVWDKSASAETKNQLKNIIREEQKHLKAFMKYKELLKKRKNNPLTRIIHIREHL